MEAPEKGAASTESGRRPVERLEGSGARRSGSKRRSDRQRGGVSPGDAGRGAISSGDAGEVRGKDETPMTTDPAAENVIKTNSRGDGQNIKERDSQRVREIPESTQGTSEAHRRSSSDDEVARKKSSSTTTTCRKGSQTGIKVIISYKGS